MFSAFTLEMSKSRIEITEFRTYSLTNFRLRLKPSNVTLTGLTTISLAITTHAFTLFRLFLKSDGYLA